MVVVTLVYTIIVELFGHSLILSLIAPLGLLILIPLWKKDAQTINGDTVNTVIKSISTTEKFVFVLLLLFISTILKATGMGMSFSTTLIFLSIIFFIYKRITTKTTSGEDTSLPNLEIKKEATKFMFSKKNKITLMIFTSLLLIGSLFYWFEIRPSKIRQECSWTTEKVELAYCDYLKWKYHDNKDSIFADLIPDKCNEEKEEYKTKKATPKEYDFCIRSKGITK